MSGEWIIDKADLQNHHKQISWSRVACIFASIWLMTSPVTFGYEGEKAMAVSDMATGACLLATSIASLNFRFRFFSWVTAFLSVWLSFSPLLFWAKSPAAYVNATFLGALIFSLTVIVPYRPERKEDAPCVPAGWKYNPSSWAQRAPVIFFGVFGWFVARYLCAFEMGFIQQVWDPFFGEGTLQVLTSKVSKTFPVPDAGLGAFAYSLEALLGCKGGKRRWYTMPWMVIAFGILVVPLGFSSIVLAILQPTVVGAWCGLCLVMAFCMLVMLALSVDEVLATLQFLYQAKKNGKSVIRIFWLGGQPDGACHALQEGFDARNMARGLSLSYNLVLTLLIGIWTLSIPHLLDLKGYLADGCFVIGALTVVFSVISMAEVVRTARYGCGLLAIALIVLPWLFPPSSCALKPVGSSCEYLIWNCLFCGIALLALSLPRGKIRDTYGSWDKCIR